jgi:hypothetical protein
MFIRKIIFAAFVAIIITNEIHAAFLIDNDFSFGKIAVTDNSSVSSVQLLRSGRATATGSIYILEIGQPGVYTLTELPPFAVVSVSTNLPVFSFSTIPGTQQFSVSALDIPSTLNADATGTVQFKVGGVLQTSGVGGAYIGPATYQVLLDIDIIF